MKKLLQKIWRTLKLCLKSTRIELENNYLKNLKNSYLYRDKYFNGPIYKLPHKIDIPDNFVKAVNKFLVSVDGFKNFKTSDVKTLNVFTPNGQTFIATIYAIERPYGMFYIKINTCEIFFVFNENIKNKLKPADFFRIYVDDKKNSSRELRVFYQCLLKNGVVKIYNVYQEWRDENNNYETKPLQNTHKIKFPVKYQDMPI